MAATPQHTYQLLTKRHGRMRSLLRDECRCGAGHQPGVHFMSAIEWAATAHSPMYVPGLKAGLYHEISWPLPNVWVGVSVEDQQRADLRIPALRDTPAAVRRLSCEPLLGSVDLAEHLIPATPYPALSGHAWDRGDLAWVVVGGESGPRSRPMDPSWARALRDQCVTASVPYFFKQFGEWAPNGWRGIMLSASNTREMPVGPKLDDVGHREVVERVGKKAAGRVLDGRTWDEFPSVAEAVNR